MRLIDLDKVRWKEGFYDMHTGEQFASMIFNTPEWLEWATAEAEVKAIPIEWIHDYLDNTFLPEGQFWAIQKMIKQWEKENET